MTDLKRPELLVTILGSILFLVDQTSCSKPLQSLLTNLFVDYDQGIRPNYGIKPVEIGITAYVLEITAIDERDMFFTTSMYFRENWVDPRLTFAPIPEAGGTNGTIQLYGDRRTMIWEPDTFIVNEITSFQHEFGQPNAFVRVSPEGKVLKSLLYTITATCPMDLHYFPFDHQLCFLEIESFGSSAKDIIYKWDAGQRSVGISSSVSLPTFRVMGHRIRTQMITLSTGNYSRLSLDISFARSSGRYVLRYFVPMIIFVSISLLSIWVLSPRIGAFINFLNLGFINLFMAEVSDIFPRISYLTAIDLFFGICILHVVLALIDSLVASFFEIRNKRSHEVIEMSTPRRSLTEDDTNLCSNQPSFFRRKAVISKFNTINMFVKCFIALLFIFCNVIYWPMYASSPPLEHVWNDFTPM